MKAFRVFSLIAFILALFSLPSFAQAEREVGEPVKFREEVYFDRAEALRLAQRSKLNEADIIGLIRLQKAYVLDYNRLTSVQEKQLRTDLYKKELLVLLSGSGHSGNVALAR